MRITVWGTGITGRETARVMRARGHEVRLVDERPHPEATLVTPADLSWAELVIPSPGIPRNHPLLAHATRIHSEIEVASTLLHGRLIAVSGTNGKTTTVTLIHHILTQAGCQAGLAGNIDPPLISLVESDPAYVVAEISSFQLEWIETFRPAIAVCLNITIDHLDRYRDLDDYAHYKLRLFENQRPGDTAIVNRDDPRLAGLATAAERIDFSASAGPCDDAAYIEDNHIFFPGRQPGPALPSGPHISAALREDMLAAALAAWRLGVATAHIEAALAGFEIIHHRFERLDLPGDITFIDDSKATNVGAVDKALAGIAGKVVLILGGRDKGGDFAALARRHRDKIRLAVVMGPESGRIFDEIEGLVAAARVDDMPAAVARACTAANPGDPVLLSPGCSSFDLFENYAQRGEVFKACAQRIVTSKR